MAERAPGVCDGMREVGEGEEGTRYEVRGARYEVRVTWYESRGVEQQP